MNEHTFYLAVLLPFDLPVNFCISLFEQRIEYLNKVMTHLEQNLKKAEKKLNHSEQIVTAAGIQHIQIEIDTSNKFIHVLNKNPDYIKNYIKYFYKEYYVDD